MRHAVHFNSFRGVFSSDLYLYTHLPLWFCMGTTCIGESFFTADKSMDANAATFFTLSSSGTRHRFYVLEQYGSHALLMASVRDETYFVIIGLQPLPLIWWIVSLVIRGCSSVEGARIHKTPSSSSSDRYSRHALPQKQFSQVSSSEIVLQWTQNSMTTLLLSLLVDDP